MNSSDQSSSYASHKTGPRAKCDQVVYEAIAKAAEIIIRARCPISSDQKNPAKTSTSPAAAASGGTSSTRFHLEVEEVESVRSILQMWKKSLHVPLRLDLYYEYCTDPNQPEQSSRKELLERWCIDYLPIVSDLDMSRQSIGNSGMKSDDTISQLRQVVKHVVILLRVLHSLTRMLPAYRLHHALTEDAKCLFVSSYGTSNGYYSNRPLGSGPGLGGGYYNNRTQDTTPQNSSKKQSQLRNMIGGRVNFSFYVSNDNYANQHLSSDTNLFSASSNRPFARHNMNPIRTPFGVLHLSGLYDESLSVERVMTDRAKRIDNFNTMWDENPNQFEFDSRTSRSIPVPNAQSHGQEGMIHQDSQSMQQPMAMQLPPRVQSRSRSSSIASHQEGRSRSSSVVSEHIIHDYANNIVERSKSAEPTPMRARISTDPGRGACQEKRVLSGLSLALMNQDEEKTESKSPSPASPLLRPVDSGDDGASLRQRMALHHPPPSTYGYAYNMGNPMPVSSSQHGALDSIHQTNSPILGPKSRTNSPIPFRLASTPPQPMFIGSVSKLNRGISVPEQEENEFAPPFKNPLTLEEAPNATQSVTISINKLNITEEPSSDTSQGALYPSPIHTKDAILPPITDVDALASSPFKLSQSVPMGSGAGGGLSSASFFSSLVIGGSAAYSQLDDGFPIALNSGSPSPFHTSRANSFNNTLLRESGSLKALTSQFLSSAPMDDEMPFAVEQESFSGPTTGSIPKPSHQNSTSELSTSSATMSSQVLSSLAHRCSTANKLKLFSSIHQDNPTSSHGKDDTNMLRDQLAEFQSFGSSAIFTGKSSSSVASSSA